MWFNFVWAHMFMLWGGGGLTHYWISFFHIDVEKRLLWIFFLIFGEIADTVQNGFTEMFLNWPVTKFLQVPLIYKKKGNGCQGGMETIDDIENMATMVCEMVCYRSDHQGVWTGLL